MMTRMRNTTPSTVPMTTATSAVPAARMSDINVTSQSRKHVIYYKSYSIIKAFNAVILSYNIKINIHPVFTTFNDTPNGSLSETW